jgi:glutamyl-tRNA synthetase
MHIGNARTALLAWLQARSQGGLFVMRMEDLDKQRARPELAAQALEDLRWLGLNWDEGPDIGGPQAPYVQSQREELYMDALRKLTEMGMIYPCFCSRAELAAIASAPHGLVSEGPSYPGTCRSLSMEERGARTKLKSPSFRFAVGTGPIEFVDNAAGPQTFPHGAGGDFVVKRADGIISYQLAVVIDDAAMGITDVLRGYDLLDSTPRQLLLYKALGLAAPRFTHVPLLTGPDGTKLAKRHGDISISSIRSAGGKPEKVIGWIAYMSGLIDRPEPIRADELIGVFDLGRIPKESIPVTDKLLQRLFG